MGWAYLFADCTEDARCHPAESIEYLEEGNYRKNGGDKLDDVYRIAAG